MGERYKILSMSDSPKPTVFVVDDEPTISSTLSTILNLSGFDAKNFTNPVTALEVASVQAPDLLITDVMMPRMNGIELGIKFRSLHPECKILLFSGQQATVNLLKEAVQQGYDFKILGKPIHPKELIAALHKL
jgi:DNA-binding NtrC family response regulator